MSTKKKRDALRDSCGPNPDPAKLLQLLEQIGEELLLERERDEPLALFARRMIEEIDLTISGMQETRTYLLRTACDERYLAKQ
jgi:hypothetical protein